MKKISVIIFCYIFALNVSYAKFSKVELIFDQDEVNVLVDNKFIKINPRFIKIDFNINEKITFFKNGYYSQTVEIEASVVFNKLKINLIKREASLRNATPVLLKNEKLIISDPITNFTEQSINEVLNQNFIKNNYIVGGEKAIFSDGLSAIDNHKFKLGIEIINSEQISSIYDYPRYMLASCKIRWVLLDTESNSIVLTKDTEGSQYVSFQSSKGIMASKKLKSIMEDALIEAQEKLLRNDEFKKITL